MVLGQLVYILLGEPDPGIGFGHARDGLCGRQHLSFDAIGGNFHFIDREYGNARLPVEYINIALFGDLGDRIDLLSVSFYGNQIGRSRDVAIPHIMMHELIMPDPFAGVGIERQKAIGEEIVTLAIAAVKVKSCGPCGHVDDLPLPVDAHATPVVGTAHIRIQVVIRRPCFISEFTGTGDGAEHPFDFPRDDIETLYISRCRPGRFRKM